MSTEPEQGDTTTYHGQSDPDTEYVLDPSPNPWRRDPVLSEYSDASRAQWADYYDIHPQFLPWEHIEWHGFDILRNVTAHLQERPKTAKQLSTSRVMDHLGIDHRTSETVGLDDIMLLHGWWRGGFTPASGTYYCNPEYPHDHENHELALFELGDSLGDPWEDSSRLERRLDLLARGASLGLPLDVLARPFGVERGHSAGKWAARHYVDYGRRKAEGKARMARTWKTIYKWGDGEYTFAEIAEAFGMPPTTVTSSIRNRASDFEPPRDPNYREVSR